MPRETATAPNAVPAERLAEFEAAARRPLRQRFKTAFIELDKPVLEDANYRAWERWKSIANGAKKICPNGWVTAANKSSQNKFSRIKLQLCH